MTSRFTALPLSTGESFVLQTEHCGKQWVILYDGGQKKGIGPTKNEQYALIRKHCPKLGKRIDIAVCSHSDKDHAGGFPDLIQTWISQGGEIGELWLPARWSAALPAILSNPYRIVSRLEEGASAAAIQIVNRENRDSVKEARGEVVRSNTSIAKDPSLTRFESVEQAICEEAMSALQEPVIADNGEGKDRSEAKELDRHKRTALSLGLDPETLEIVRRNLDDASQWRHPLTNVHSQWPSPQLIFNHWSAQSFHLARALALSVVKTAETIRRIAEIAAANSIPVRWFDFSQFEKGHAPSGGNRGILHPLNSVEVKKIRQEDNSLNLFFLLWLTEQNVSSLVFQRVPTATEPSVIFLADSRLAFGIDKPGKNFPNHLACPISPVIFTAAHHGSRNNDHAYMVLRCWLGQAFNDSIAVRNGGVHSQTLADFRNLKKRRCAQCYQCHGGKWSQLVQIVSNGPHWAWPPSCGNPCCS